MILKRNIEVKTVRSIGESHSNVRTSSALVNNLDDKVSGAVRDGLHGRPGVRIHRTRGEQFSGVLVLQLQLHPLVGLHDLQTSLLANASIVCL